MPSLRLTLAAAGAMTVLAAGAADAQNYRTYNPDYGYAPGVEYAPQPYNPRGPRVRAQAPYYEGLSAQQSNNYEYNYSGTLGRQGLGADPRHPEGPGNQSLGGFR
jgi:hypothetical protein